jgi:hypothetical protein
MPAASNPGVLDHIGLGDLVIGVNHTIFVLNK